MKNNPAADWGTEMAKMQCADWDDPLVAPRGTFSLSAPPPRKKGQFEHHRSPPTPPPLDPVRNVYVTLLPKSMTDAGLALLAGRFGMIESHKAIIDPDTGECKGFGFVMYSTVLEAHEAIEQLNRAGYQASPAKASFTSTLRKYADKDSRNLYLHGHVFLPCIRPELQADTPIAYLSSTTKLLSVCSYVRIRW